MYAIAFASQRAGNKLKVYYSIINYEDGLLGHISSIQCLIGSETPKPFLWNTLSAMDAKDVRPSRMSAHTSRDPDPGNGDLTYFLPQSIRLAASVSQASM